MPVAFLAALASCLLTASAAPDPAPPEAVREAMLAVYVHGVTDESAREVLDPADAPALVSLLADSSFPRRDNLVAFLAHLGDGNAVGPLMSLLDAPPAGWSTPEEDRALLMVPTALGHIVRRGDDGALDRLLEMTAGGPAAASVMRAAAHGADPVSLEADLLGSALDGLALSGRATARDRLVDVASDRIIPHAARDLSARALDALELFDELWSAAGTASSTGGSAPAGATTPVQPDPTGGSGGPGSSVDPIGGPDGQPSLAVFDTNNRVHDGGITFANHVDLTNPMTDGRLDTILPLANLRAGRSDYSGDVACCVTSSRLGTAQTFGTPGDGLDVINNSNKQNAAIGNSSGRVKVVRSISYCGGPGSGIVGCGNTPGNGILVVRLSNQTSEGLLWKHEYGHNTGLPHAGDSRRIMYGTLTGNNRGLSQQECNTFHSPVFNNAFTQAVLTDTGACTDGDADEVQDGIDNCPAVANNPQSNSDSDAFGNACDNCDTVANPGQEDFDLDGAGDACDSDDDNDGAADGSDCAPLDASASEVAGRADSLLFTAGSLVEMTWTPGFQASESNVYRGTLTATFNPDWACEAGGLGGNTHSDPDTPPPGEGFHYVATGENVCGESDAGEDSNGQARLPAPCP